jgi:hypothetical protein
MAHVVRADGMPWAAFQSGHNGWAPRLAFCSAQCSCCFSLGSSAGRSFAGYGRTRWWRLRRHLAQVGGLEQLRQGEAAHHALIPWATPTKVAGGIRGFRWRRSTQFRYCITH